jgi:DNA-binding NtrC family response regulator
MRSVEKKISVLITERNSHVRDYLKREMEAEGYVVRLAENGHEMLKHVYHSDPLDVIILDPDLPDADVTGTLMILKDRIPRVAVVFHTFEQDWEEYGKILEDAVFVEKRGNSIESLKQEIFNIIKLKNSP